MPCVPYAGPGVGMAFLPEVGAGVWIEFEGGDMSYPVWVGCYWREGEIPPDATPTVKTIVTAQGCKILLDDDAQTITLTDSSNNKVTLASDGITLERGASKVVVRASEKGAKSSCRNPQPNSGRSARSPGDVNSTWRIICST